MRIKPATLLLAFSALFLSLPVETTLADGRPGWDWDGWNYDGAQYRHHHRHHKEYWHGENVARTWPRRSVTVYRVEPRHYSTRIAGHTHVYRDSWR